MVVAPGDQERKYMEAAYLPSSAEPLPFWAAGRTRCLAMSVRRYGDIRGAVVASRSSLIDQPRRMSSCTGVTGLPSRNDWKDSTQGWHSSWQSYSGCE
jgi:hypothetical protein